MNKQKQVYLSPETETLVVQVEGVVCQSTGNVGINDWQNGTDFPIGF